ncbi:ileal sodium/bile acid cotransporter-like [Centruroides sculpturatus]|uniref:ileal sodium/bile acid cotransporter-like n=1 Tax=Centruroides sculpturatus TaxID=218467 RepID=UPI000C6D7BC4|nr:ileal sodium/bile acid cotransporter-like [Centruroides sculpturatus]XP_023220389.1 ileal sodium/bile acid cotransporter-like [Centruroides sculpturatus]
MNRTEDSLYSNSTVNFTNNTINDDLRAAHNVLMIILITSIMIAMGADICWKQIWMHVRKPFGPIIGVLCQFVMMPLVGFIYNKIFKFEPRIAAGLLIMSCCPGGAVSNAFAYYLNGDVSLSVTMTTVSTILALGMMPLNVWIYGIRIESNALIIPYNNIALSLIIVTSPVLVGMAIKWKVPKVSVYVTKGGSAIGFALIIVVLTIDFVVYQEFLCHISWRLIVTCIIMPITGILLGYFIAFICRRSNAICKTIAIESGIQNAAVVFSVIILSFDMKKYFTVLLIPLFYATFQFVIFSVFCFSYNIYVKCKKKNEAVQNTENNLI